MNNWKLRKFLLSGIYLTYFDDNGSVKGRIDISGCVVRRMSPAECKNPACKYAFGLFTSRSVRRCLICATNEEDRTAWINAIEAQITEFQDVVRRFITNNEVVLGNSLVTKKNLIGMETSFRLVITNFPRILVIEPNSISLKEQILFKLESPPTIQIVRLHELYLFILSCFILSCYSWTISALSFVIKCVNSNGKTTVVLLTGHRSFMIFRTCQLMFLK